MKMKLLIEVSCTPKKGCEQEAKGYLATEIGAALNRAMGTGLLEPGFSVGTRVDPGRQAEVAR